MIMVHKSVIMRLSVSTLLIGKIPVKIFQETALITNFKRSMMYLCRTKASGSEALKGKWSLEHYGRQGSWDYVFKYAMGNGQSLYQLDDLLHFGNINSQPLMWKYISPESLSLWEGRHEVDN